MPAIILWFKKSLLYIRLKNKIDVLHKFSIHSRVKIILFGVKNFSVENNVFLHSKQRQTQTDKIKTSPLIKRKNQKTRR